MMGKAGALLAAGLIVTSFALPLRADESRPSLSVSRPPIKMKSEKKAMILSVVGTIVPLAVSASYLLAHDPSSTQADMASISMLFAPLGPSLGYFYAGATGRALLGLGIRLAGLAGIIGGTMGLDASGDETLMKVFIAGGIGVAVASTIFDLAGLDKAVRRHNAKVQGLQMALAPVVSPKALGLQARLSF